MIATFGQILSVQNTHLVTYGCTKIVYCSDNNKIKSFIKICKFYITKKNLYHNLCQLFNILTNQLKVFRLGIGQV